MNCTAHGRAWCFERPCMEERRRATLSPATFQHLEGSPPLEATQIHGATLGFAEPSVFEPPSPSVFDTPASSDCGPSDSPTSDSGSSDSGSSDSGSSDAGCSPSTSD